MTRYYLSFCRKFCQVETYFRQRDTCSFGNFGIELLTMHFQVLQDFFYKHGLLRNHQDALMVAIGAVIS